MKVKVLEDEFYPIYIPLLSKDMLNFEDHARECEIPQELIDRYIAADAEWTEIQWELGAIYDRHKL